MTWAKFDDRFYLHPKVDEAGEEAGWLYVCAVLYSNDQLTDGFISRERLPKLAYPKKAVRLAERLVKARLFDVDGVDFRIHNFHRWNPKAADVRAKREAERLRKSGRKPGGKPQGSDEDVQRPTPDSDSATDVVTSPDSYELGHPQPEENASQVETLTARWLSAVRPEKRKVVAPKAPVVIAALLGYFDAHVVDEMIGTCLNLEGDARPGSNEYLWKTARKWGLERDIILPERMPA